MKSKKLLLGSLSTMALVATPIAAVVSCDNKDGGNDSDTKVAKTTKMVKTNAKGFFIHEHFIPEALASKAGQVMFEGHTYVWDKPLKERQTIQVFEDGKAKDYNSVLQADDKHFVLPLNGQSGVGYYFTKEEIKRSFDQHLLVNSMEGDSGVIKFNLDLPTETKGGKTLVTQAGIKNLNTLLKITGLEVESVSTEAIAKKGEMPKHTKYKITWAKDAPKTAAEFKTQFESLGITGTATSITANNIAGSSALTTIAEIQAAAGTGVTLTLGAGKTFSIPTGFEVKFKGITATANGTSTLTLALTKTGGATVDVNITITVTATTPANTDAADVAAIKAALESMTGTRTTAIKHGTLIVGRPRITNNATLLSSFKFGPNNAVQVTFTGSVPSDLKGTLIQLKDIAQMPNSAGSGNLVLTVTKGSVSEDATIVITHA